MDVWTAHRRATTVAIEMFWNAVTPTRVLAVEQAFNYEERRTGLDLSEGRTSELDHARAMDSKDGG